MTKKIANTLLLQLATCTSLKIHLNTHGGDHQCSFCGSTFFEYSNLRNHEHKVHGKADFFDCEHCEEKCSSQIQLKDHIKANHKIKFTKIITVYDNDFFL